MALRLLWFLFHVQHLHLRGGIHMKMHVTLKSLGRQLYEGVLTNIKPEVHPFVYRETGHQSMLVVYVSTQGTNPVG